MTTVGVAELTALCVSAVRAAGGDDDDAEALAAATVAAELAGSRAVGVAHFFDYIDAFRAGRLATGAKPVLSFPTPGTLIVDADEGLAQKAFHSAVGSLRRTVEERGIGALWLRNCYTCGELGYYPRYLAETGLFSIAFANSSPLVALGGSSRRLLGTNPLAYAVPRPGRASFVVDQATSASAYVKIRSAAQVGQLIPPDWAIDVNGEPTVDAGQAMDGALLPFGGYRGGNIALLVELLATLAGASFSVDAPPFDDGDESPGIGVCVMGFDPGAIVGDPNRMAAYLDRLHDDFGVELPAMRAELPGDSIDLDAALYERLVSAASHGMTS